MRVMVMIKANKQSEAGVLPSERLLSDMMNYHEELVKAGVMIAAEGLYPSTHGKRVRFSKNGPVVTDGPFAETKEMIGGFWLWKVNSLDEAVEWLKKCPAPDDPDIEGEIEIRQVFELEDFEGIDPKLLEKEQELLKKV